MNQLEKRLSDLERRSEKPLNPMVLYLRGMSAQECAERFPDPPNTKGNPLMLIIRPYPEEVQP